MALRRALLHHRLPSAKGSPSLLERLFHQNRATVTASMVAAAMLPTGDKLIQRIRALDKDRSVRFDLPAPERTFLSYSEEEIFLRQFNQTRNLKFLQPDEARRRTELEEMEKRKVEIDRAAEAKARTELWMGLGFIAAQTAASLRLTFWELSWDVMEPVCFFAASFYFMAGYAFFLRTARDPTFEGVFQSRFEAKQRRLMKDADFDFVRFRELRRQVKG